MRNHISAQLARNHQLVRYRAAGTALLLMAAWLGIWTVGLLVAVWLSA